jgi:predicted XRE-type DNA-binding protein
VSEHRGRAWREGEWWVIDVEDVGTTQARTLDKIDHMARSLVADLTGSPYESVSVAVAIDLPPAIAGQVEQLRQATSEAAELAREAAELQADVVRSLAADEGLTGREIAALLKVTPGRVSQIARKAVPGPRRHGKTPGATTKTS